MDPEATKTFHTLKLHTHCGGGAYGDVYFCEDISGRKMAVKIVSKKKLGDSWNQELRGVVNYRKITENAPLLLQIFHVEEDEETFFYTMEAADSASETEYIPDTLAHRLQSGPLPQADLLRILTGVFQGIKLIHEAGFTHRDIKPDNILFVKGVPKLADIGLFSSLSATMTQLAGTLDFIPPEERSADTPLHTDRKSRQQNDLYAFGKVIYCAVTGISPQEYPTLPKNLPLTQPLKFFFRLAFSLCSKDPEVRLVSLDELEREFHSIRRKLLYGETVADQIQYWLKYGSTHVKSHFYTLARLAKNFWYALCSFILLGGGIVYYFFVPEEPYDITKEKVKKYVNEEYKIYMDVPATWEIISLDALRRYQDRTKNDVNPQINKEFIDRMLTNNKYGCDYIFCDFDKTFQDNILVCATPIPSQKSLDLSEGEMRLVMQTHLKMQLGYDNFKIFRVRRLNHRGYIAYYIDCAPKKDTRQNIYWFVREKDCIAFTLTCKQKTYAKRNIEFRSVLKTLKIGK